VRLKLSKKIRNFKLKANHKALYKKKKQMPFFISTHAKKKLYTPILAF